jgi:5'-phosphate synthase pdxT subunit
MLERLGARTREVRVPGDLESLDGLVIPGGESTTMTLGVAREGLAEPLRALAQAGTPVLGSCAGLIMLDSEHLGLMDMRAERNAFGRQIRSFEADVNLRGIEGGPMRGIFIRAPWIAEHAAGVEILGEVDGHPVAARQGSMLAVAFHSELSDDDRLHRMFLQGVEQARMRRPSVSSRGT